MAGFEHPRIEVISTSTCDRAGEPVCVGIPLARGWCRTVQGLRLIDAAGVCHQVQAAVLDTWSDGSAKWVLLDFFADCTAGSLAPYDLVHDETVPQAKQYAKNHALTVNVIDKEAIVDTGGANFVVGPSSIADRRLDLVVTGIDGQSHRAKLSSVVVEAAGPLRATVRLGGDCRIGRRLVAVDVRLTFWATMHAVKAEITLKNPAASGHPGGFWELGSAGALFIQDASLVFRVSPPGELVVECSVAPASELARMSTPFEIYQDSSGGESWQSANHVDRIGQITTKFRGYKLSSGSSHAHGLRADPILRASWAGGELSVGVPRFWQNFPRALEASADEIRVRLFPAQAGTHELQGGEQKTHLVAFSTGPDGIASLPLDWVREPLTARATPEWYAKSGAVPYLSPESTDRSPEYLQLIHSAIAGPASFFAKREVIDDYGWRNFGDLYADHEATLHHGNTPLISHYNNQYDAIAGFAVHFMRSGDPRWWNLLTDLAAHVVDIDIYHTELDKSAYNGGMFWHTAHYVDAGKSTHRSYPRAPGICGGGPANEHNYSTGLMLAYFMTGDSRYRDAVIGLARWVLDMDDGRKTILRWVDRGPTGLASKTTSADYHGPGRGAAYSIETLLNAYRLTSDASYLEAAEKLIRRCIHPDDDVDARQLLDAERRWHYTVFLQILGRYLDDKLGRREVDQMYSYAKASLLRYARWMAQHEYPYLDKPNALEYPNETWAAQDMRKSEVFMHAARHCPEAEREMFEERAAFFFRYVTTKLMSMDTRGLTRPVVLMLSNGYMRAWFIQRTAADRAPEVSVREFGHPAVFVPQKSRVLRKCGLGLLRGLA